MCLVSFNLRERYIPSFGPGRGKFSETAEPTPTAAVDRIEACAKIRAGQDRHLHAREEHHVRAEGGRRGPPRPAGAVRFAPRARRPRCPCQQGPRGRLLSQKAGRCR